MKWILILVLSLLLCYPATAELSVSVQIPVVKESLSGMIPVARGDVLTIDCGNNTGGQPGNSTAVFWLFSQRDYISEHIYDRATSVDKQGRCWAQLTPQDTNYLVPEKYTAVLQAVGPNGIREISYDTTDRELVSPWRAVEPVSIKDLVPNRAKDALLNMCKPANGTCDDVFTELIVKVEEPFVQIKDFSSSWDPKNPIVTVEGITNLYPWMHKLKVILDPDQQITPKLLAAATKQINITPFASLDYPRNTWNFTFGTASLYPGRHEIKVIADTGAYDTISFDLMEDWPTPVPTTPSPRRYVLGFEETPEITMKPTPVANETANVTLVPTPTPTNLPAHTPTPKLLTPSPTATKKNFLNAGDKSPIGKAAGKMPVGPEVAIFALISVGYLVLRKR
jgi:hypothetical protein